MNKNLSILFGSLVLLGAYGSGAALAQHAHPQPAGPAAVATDQAHHQVNITSEYEFIAGMIPHHEEAVDSARSLLQTTSRPQMRDLAEAIIREQNREIAMMQDWLAQRYSDRTHLVFYHPMMRDPAGMTPHEADHVFLTDMIAHHQMALDKARQLLDRNLAQHEKVAVLAREIIESQQKEIDLMKGWLQQWYGVETRP